VFEWGRYMTLGREVRRYEIQSHDAVEVRDDERSR
jgi:hypothetical protein